MCTVTWARHSGGYHLLCNRDEKRTRAQGIGPRIEERGGVRFVAPADRNFGGTWIAVNEFGVSLCLLNGVGTAPGATRSRGLLVRELISAECVEECALWLHQLDLAVFAPFTLAMVEPDRSAALAQWDGKQLTVIPDADSLVPLISSSHDPIGVSSCRLDEFHRRVNVSSAVDPAQLYWFHASHSGQADAYSPCMHRPDAETVSFSWVVVTPGDIRFFYSPAAPCRSARGEQQFLARAA